MANLTISCRICGEELANTTVQRAVEFDKQHKTLHGEPANKVERPVGA